MSRDKESVALITDHRLTNRVVASSVDPARYVMHELSSDNSHLTAKLIELDPAIIFVRATLKCGNGFELCDRIKDLDALQRARVVFLSQDESNREKAIQHRANHFLTIVKPIVVAELLSRVKRLLPSDDSKRPEKILVTDDSDIVRNMIVQAFRAQGLQVDQAENGQEAFEKVQAGNYHVFITKPFKSERLVAEVERVLAESRLLRQRKSMRLYLSNTAADTVDRISEQCGDVDTPACDLIDGCRNSCGNHDGFGLRRVF